MCGIAGFAGEHKERIDAMLHALIHRGPDGNATLVTHGASLGHARLAILDPRPEGNQPMWNEEKTIAIVYNGEIFNFKHLRDANNLQCKTNTDTEVILKLFEKEGIDCVKKLQGMFAFGIYDTRTQTWHLARDTSGIKPLYIAYPDGKLHFASEMRALLKAFDAKPAINMHALSLFVRLQYVPGPQTLCEGIESLPPGTMLSWNEQGEQRQSFTPNLSDVPSWKSAAACKKDIPQLMDGIVRDHLVSDKPIGIYLSGGMDSSILLHHMASSTDKPIETFTVRFDVSDNEDAKRINTDAELAAMTAKHYGTNHHDILMTADDYRDLYAKSARALDIANADAVAPAQVLLSEHAKDYVDVVLTGAGGDELFGGYPRYRIAHVLNTLRFIPSALRGVAGTMLGQPSDVLKMQPGAILAERLLGRPQQEIQSFTKDWYDNHAVTELFHTWFQKIDASDPVRTFMEFDRHTWLVDESLRLTDAVTMAHGVEARVPFLDTRLIAAITNTPGNCHVNLRNTKILLKDAYRNILPDHLYTLPKASFFPPFAKWMRREASTIVEQSIEAPIVKELFDQQELESMFAKHKSFEQYNLHTLSTITQFAHWYAEVYDA